MNKWTLGWSLVDARAVRILVDSGMGFRQAVLYLGLELPAARKS